MTAFRSAVVALPLAFVAACTEQKPAPASTARVVVAEIRAPNVGPGSQLDMVVPDLADSISNHNPPGSVEVFSTAATAEYPDSSNPCGARAVYVPVTVKSYATETLSNTMIEFTSMTPVSHTICNTQPGTKPAGATGQVVTYGELTGSAVSDGTAAGGATNVTWSFNYETAAPFSFVARVWADVIPAPPTNPSPTSGIYCGGTCNGGLVSGPVVLSWTGSTPQGHVEIWGDAAFATSLIEQADVSGEGSDPSYAFSYTVSNATPGQRWWRAVNRFTGSGGSTVNGTFAVAGSYRRDAAPTNLVAADVDPGQYRLSADSPAPLVDFYSWDWSNPPYYVWTVDNQFFHSSITQSGQTFSTQMWDPLGNPTISWRACTQYGTAGNVSTQGACANGPSHYVQ